MTDKELLANRIDMRSSNVTGKRGLDERIAQHPNKDLPHRLEIHLKQGRAYTKARNGYNAYRR